MFRANDVVQFNENHKWCGCLGIITEIKHITDDNRYMVAIPIPNNESCSQTAYIYVLESENAIELIGVAKLVPPKGE